MKPQPLRAWRPLSNVTGRAAIALLLLLTLLQVGALQGCHFVASRANSLSGAR